MSDEESDSLECEIRTPGGGLPSEPSFRPIASLAFWCCLALSAAIFATVFLAPRLRTFRDLTREYDGIQRELLTSERQVDYLQKVVDALRHDPEFAAELARVDFGVSGSEERIPVAAQLSLSGEPPAINVEAEGVVRPFPRNLLDTPLLDKLADDRSVRSSLLGAVSLLLLVAFTFLCGTRPRWPVNKGIGWRARCRRWFAERYAKV
jgi:hypothetical protein